MITSDDISIEQFVRSKWFIASARLASIVGAIVVSVGGVVAGWAVFDTREQAQRAIAAVGEVRQTQSERAIVGDALAATVTGLSGKVDRLDAKVDTSNETLAEIRGAVNLIARQQQKTADTFLK